jgi:hypothetical protein
MTATIAAPTASPSRPRHILDRFWFFVIAGLVGEHANNSRRAEPAREREMARRKAQTYGVRDPFGTTAGASRRANRDVFSAPGLALVRSVTLERVDRSFSWLPAGPPIGSGRSSGTARALVLRIRARRRRTSSRFTNALEKRPSSGRDGGSVRQLSNAGISS